MNFGKVPKPPTAEQCLDWPRTEVTHANVPSMLVVKREIRLWKRRLESERLDNFDGDEYATNVCRMMLHGLSKAEEHIRLADQRTHQAGGNLSAQAELYMSGATVVAFSRMWKVLGLDELRYQPIPEPAFVLNDFFPKHLAQSALHFQDGSLHVVAGIERPAADAEVWFEGEGLYLKASSPASPSPGMEAHFKHAFGDPMPVEEYTTLAPRLKVAAQQILPPAPSP